MKISIYNRDAKEIEKIEILDTVFNVSANHSLVHQVATSLYSNRRQVIANTKTRAERKGSGKKPWKQKGTGRARVGSVRNPVWRKGGIVFGPRANRNFKKDINKKMNSCAIRVVLSEKIKSKQLRVVNEFTLDGNKTKIMANMLKSFEIKGSVLLLFSQKEKDMRRSSRNIKKTDNLLTSQLNVLDMLNHKNLVLSVESLRYLEEKYNPKPIKIIDSGIIQKNG